MYAIRSYYAMAIGTGMQILRPFDFGNQLRGDLKSTAGADAALNGSQRLVLPGRFEFHVAGQECFFHMGRPIPLLHLKLGQFSREFPVKIVQHTFFL